MPKEYLQSIAIYVITYNIIVTLFFYRTACSNRPISSPLSSSGHEQGKHARTSQSSHYSLGKDGGKCKDEIWPVPLPPLSPPLVHSLRRFLTTPCPYPLFSFLNLQESSRFPLHAVPRAGSAHARSRPHTWSRVQPSSS